MKKIKFFLFFLFSFYTQGETIDILTFYYPPFMGESYLSQEGLLIDIIKAACSEENLDANIIYLPPKRSISELSSNNFLAFIGVKESFAPETIEKLDIVPLTELRFITFYLKDRFPSGFSFETLEDLKNYSISIIPGITEVIGKQNNLDIETSHDLDLVFKKIEGKRNDIGVAVDLSIKIMLNELFPEKRDLFNTYNNKVFVSTKSVLILNKYHPDYLTYSDKLKKGLYKIALNGNWVSILEKYYGKNNVPKESINLIDNYIKNFQIKK